jgi:hypothetical protein
MTNRYQSGLPDDDTGQLNPYQTDNENAAGMRVQIGDYPKSKADPYLPPAPAAPIQAYQPPARDPFASRRRARGTTSPQQVAIGLLATRILRGVFLNLGLLLIFITSLIWLFTTPAGYFWPIWVMLGVFIALFIVSMISLAFKSATFLWTEEEKNQMLEEYRRRIRP